jgi:hypothetical protein
MQSFIVLGIIPGTNIQTTLNFWLAVTALLVLLIFRRRLQAVGSRVRRELMVRRIARTIETSELAPAAL